MDAAVHFRGKRVTVMGLGLLGRGVGDAKYLAECGAEVVVTDLKSAEELAPSVAQLKSFPNVTFVFGEHRLEDFRDRELILKAAGVPLDSEYIVEAKKNSIPVRMSADLFAEISEVPIIGITGTRGKSSVAHMVYEILKAAGEKVLLGGNVRGISNLELLKEVTPEHIAVLELDSWQLQGWGEAKMSPHIAVFTTLYKDHMNYYKDDFDAYLADKANIFLYQKPQDVLILGAQCALEIQEKYEKFFTSHFEIWGAHDFLADWKLSVLGEHNRYNAALALAVVRVLGIDDAVTRKALEDFKGVPGRLEFLREVRGVKIYNDTTSTTPEATLAALAALDPPHTILIMGGADKGLDMNALLVKLGEMKRVILLAGTGTSRVLEFIPDASVFDDFEKAVHEGFAAAGQGDTLLFSPAFASFGMFKNEFDRGDQFTAIVKAL